MLITSKIRFLAYSKYARNEFYADLFCKCVGHSQGSDKPLNVNDSIEKSKQKSGESVSVKIKNVLSKGHRSTLEMPEHDINGFAFFRTIDLSFSIIPSTFHSIPTTPR